MPNALSPPRLCRRSREEIHLAHRALELRHQAERNRALEPAQLGRGPRRLAHGAIHAHAGRKWSPPVAPLTVGIAVIFSLTRTDEPWRRDPNAQS